MTSTINNQVLQTLRALEPELRAVGVCHVSVFGSVARGDDSASSDVDLAVDLTPDSAPNGFQFVVYIERLKKQTSDRPTARRGHRDTPRATQGIKRSIEPRSHSRVLSVTSSKPTTREQADCWPAEAYD